MKHDISCPKDTRILVTCAALVVVALVLVLLLFVKSKPAKIVRCIIHIDNLIRSALGIALYTRTVVHHDGGCGTSVNVMQCNTCDQHDCNKAFP